MPTPKGQISSRLLNMKFMQRGAATARPTDSAPNTPNEPPAKRMRLSTGASPSYSGVDSPSSVASEEDLRHIQALERQQQEAGETQWVLKARGSARTPLRVVQASFADLDDVSEEYGSVLTKGSPDVQRIAQQTVAGRMVFGKKPIPSAMETNNGESTADDDSETSDDEDGEVDDDDPTAQMLREERRRVAQDARTKRHAKKSAKAQEINRLADIRRKREINLNGLTSISGAAQRTAFDQSKKAFAAADRARGGFSEQRNCYKCGQPGHLARDCKGSSRMDYG